MDVLAPTISAIFKDRVKQHPAKTALRVKTRGIYRDITWAEFGFIVDTLSLGLIKIGLKPEDCVAILSGNRPEWAYSDFAIISCGGVTVPIYASDTADEVQYILNDTEAKYIFVSDSDQLEKVLSIVKDTRLKKIILFDELKTSAQKTLNFKELLDLGEIASRNEKVTYETRFNNVKEGDLAAIIYTSGSTGPSKGVMLTHRNFISNCKSSASCIKIGNNDTYLSFLPLSHIFEKMAGFFLFIMQGGIIAYAENINTVVDNMKEISPTIVCGVPRFFEKIYTEILNTVIHGSKIKKNMFFWAYNVGKLYTRIKQSGKKLPTYLTIQKALLVKPIAEKIKSSFGGKLRFFISGGAPLSREIAEFFLAFDILILEGYGLTETSPVISVNTPSSYKIGTVGRPISEVTVKIAPDGEIMVSGPNLMKGYLHKYQDTDSTIRDGWLYTGDIGYLDKDGFLIITDRKKDIIVTSGGKNIAPLEIETCIKADRYISEAMVYGDKRNYLTVLIVPEFKNLADYAKYKKISFRNTTDLVKNDNIKKFISRRIDKQQIKFPRYMQIKKFVLLDKELTQDRGELTPTMKIKRKVVTSEYKDILDNLYEEKY